MKKRLFQLGIFLVVIAFAVSAAAQMDWAHPRYQKPKVYVIGDSLSDPGNLYELTSESKPPTVPFPISPPYARRFSNGPVWTEYFAKLLRVKMDSLAYGGAFTGVIDLTSLQLGEFSNLDSIEYSGKPYFLPLDLPGVEEEVGELLADHPKGLNPNALYVVWAGANDLFLYLDLTGQAGGDPTVFQWILADAVQNIAKTLCTLSAAGARHFAVANLPDIGSTPFGTSKEPTVASFFTVATTRFNNGLAAALGALPCADEVETLVMLDVFTFLEDVMDHPRVYGLKNVKKPCLTVSDDGSYKVCAKPDTYLFWDDVHPTTTGHSILAKHFLADLCGCGEDHHGWGPHHDDWGKEPPPMWRQLCSGVR